MPSHSRYRSPGREYGRAFAIVAVTSAAGLALRSQFKPIDIAMLFLLAVVMVAAQSRRGPALLATVLSIAVFDFAFVPPYYTFNVHETSYFLTFGVMLTVALTMSGLTGRVRLQADEANERERRTAALYALERDLTQTERPEDLITITVRHLGRAVSGEAFVLLADEGGLPTWPPTPLFQDVSVRVAAELAFERGEPAGSGTNHGAETEALALPFRTAARTLGVVVVAPTPPDRAVSVEEHRTAAALTDLAATALERAMLAERHEKARVEIEGERLRTSLLSSLSHDLRTPLASIEGAASSLLEDAGALTADGRRDLAETVLEESHRMARLVGNLLDMVRVETGALAVRKSWQPLEEALGVALLRLEEQLKGHPVEAALSADLPLVPIDELLLEQVFINLLENASKYAPAGTPISVRAWTEGDAVVVEVGDRGPGVPAGERERIFQKFHRGSGTDEPGPIGGTGLGLTICRGIIHAHGGHIWVETRAGGGAAFRFSLPLDGPPPKDLPTDQGEES